MRYEYLVKTLVIFILALVLKVDKHETMKRLGPLSTTKLRGCDYVQFHKAEL